MCAWGASIKSCDSLLTRVENNDPTLVELVILPMKTFGSMDVSRLVAIFSKGKNRHLRSLQASGHAICPDDLKCLGAAIGIGKNCVERLALGDSSMGDDGISALCDGFSTADDPLRITSLDLSWKGM